MRQSTSSKKNACFAVDESEWQRLQELNVFENAARNKGFQLIAGIDEAGRGPLAGPVVAAACVIPPDIFIPGINDSKKLLPKKREELFNKITQDSRITYGVGVINSLEIDKINIFQATVQAMLKAVAKLSCIPDILLVDGMLLPHPTIPSQKIIKGDSLSQSIAAASIIAKETRDRLMIDLHEIWPQYGFDQHKGYGTAMHLEALEKYGPCPVHRMTFEPCKQEA